MFFHQLSEVFNFDSFKLGDQLIFYQFILLSEFLNNQLLVLLDHLFPLDQNLLKNNQFKLVFFIDYFLSFLPVGVLLLGHEFSPQSKADLVRERGQGSLEFVAVSQILDVVQLLD